MSESIYRALRGLSRRENRLRAVKSKFLDTPSGKIYFGYISCAVLSIAMAFLWQWAQIELFKSLSLIFLLLCYIGYMVHPVVLFIYHRKALSKFFKNPLSVIYDNAKRNHKVDSRYLSYFMSKETQNLEIVHLEMMAEKEAFEKRTSLIVGAIEKVGLIPGVLALLLSMGKVKDIELDWVLAIAYATPLLYGFGALSHVLVTKMSRHIALLEYVLEKKA